MARGRPDPSLGAAVRSLREDRGLTQERLAVNANLSLGTLQRLELGQSDPSWSTVTDLAVALDVSLGKLAARIEKPR